MEEKAYEHSFFINTFLRLGNKVNDLKIMDRAAIVTYYILLSLGPFIMLLFSLFTYLLADNVDVVIDFANSFYEGADLIIDPILAYLSDSRSTIFTIVGVFAALFSSSKAAKHTIKALENIFSIKKTTGIKRIVSSYAYAILFTLALALALMIFFVFSVSGDPIANIVYYFFSYDLNKLFLWRFMKNFFPIIFLVVFVTAIFKAFSEIGNKDDESKKINFFEALLGAGFVSLGWILGSIGFSFYINNFSSSNAVYGALGSIMVIMLWFYFLIFMLLLGAALIVAYTDEKNTAANLPSKRNS